MSVENKKPSVKKNFVYSTLYQIFYVLTPFITAPYISRVLGAQGVGIQSFTTSNQSYFLLIAALGTMSYGAREISMNRDDPYKRSKLFWEIELMTVGTSMVALLGWIVLIVSSTAYRQYYVVLTIGIFATLFDITWFFNGIEEFKLTVIRNTFFRVLGIVCLFVFIKDEDDLLLYIFITAITTLLSSLSLWPYMKRYLVKVNPREFRFKRHFHETIIYFVPTIATSIYTVLDRTLIGLITRDMYENGYYQQAEKITNIAKSFVFTSLNAVMGVRISYLYAENKFDEIHRRIENSMNYIFFMGFGACFGIMGVAKTFVPVFFGPGYDKVIPLLYIFSPIIVIIGISNCLGSQYYTPCGKRSESAKYIVVGAIINLCLNLALIPRFAAFGAAIASIIAEAAVTVLYIRHSGDYGKAGMLLKAGYKKLIAGVVMFWAVYALNQLNMKPIFVLLLQLVSGLAVYVITLFLVKDLWTIDYSKKVLKRFQN